MSDKVNLNSSTKKEYVRKIFNDISGTYDLLNHLLSFGIDIYWRKKSLKGLHFRDEAICLDLAAGTGDFGITAYKMHNMNVIGYDLAINSLKLFSKKIEKESFRERFIFINGEAERLSIKDESVDMVTIAFGIRNFYDTQKSLFEIYRVLRERGVLNILEFSLPRNPIIRFIYLLYFNYILPFIGRIISKEKTAYTYLPSSVEEFDRKDTLITEIITAGFREIQIESMTFGVVRNIRARKILK